MPTIDKTFDLPAAGASATFDVLENSQYQYLPYNAKLDIGFKAYTVGGSGETDVRADAFCGSDLLQQDGAVPAPSGASNGLGIQFPYDFLLSDMGAQGERVGVTLRCSGATGATGGKVRVVVKLQWI